MKIKLGEALRYEQPTKYIVASEKYNDSYATPVLTAGKSFILGYTNEESGIYDNLPVIIFDDFTTDIKYVDFPFKVKSSAMKMLQPANENYNLKFFYYLIKYMNFQPTSHQRHWISKFAEMEFDIPERVKQDQIVEKLDKLVEMQSKKTIQLKKYDDLVKSQFIEMFNNKNFEQVLLSAVIDYEQPTKYIVSSENYKDEYPTPVLTAGKSFILGFTNEINGIYKGSDKPTLIFDDFTTYCKYVDFDFKVKSSAMKLLHLKNADEQLLYYFYAINKIGFKPESHQRHWISKFANFKVGKPPIELQNQFADFVKHIDKLKFTIKESIEKLNLCYQSLMKEYFE